jgi:hypothetical protein
MKNTVPAYRRLGSSLMHVTKPFGQRPLTTNMHGRRRSGLTRPAAADVMVYRKNVENARYVLVNFYGFFFSGFGSRTS